MSNMRRRLSAGGGMLTGQMSRHTTFRFCLDPTVEQQQVLARHAGAARFAFNQCLRMVKRTLAQRKTAPNVNVLWTGFDLINAFNAWKKTNHRLARAISDAGWAEFAKLLAYKQAWRGSELVVADRWYPSSKQCAACGAIRGDLTLADRLFTCGCGHSADRDTNAATNLARWGQDHHDLLIDPRTPEHRGRANNARRRDGSDQHPTCAGETSPKEAGTDVHTAPAA
jgi:transposase